ncbi:flagella basal body P-ring formation protein FlgA [Jannaschia pagri]|uniref:Flagella basal body P-ring formation protein FlgA n=1 Tax=Jannaschia pagri TaxID=2829797 RepID=A0ABQ4NMJ1_9RHOB|nr:MULTISPECIES: flagellar basal body P-ring formation chaperone FlgA [unclassified Jannaschia]GIT91626.1 flagella basal body P-ring formation protein FlgA [Jannaschia sp. AI_61]GIT95460.1 flagella basal body P-ring formation protein FlgA [Jannaschia sp. AI_62]
MRTLLACLLMSVAVPAGAQSVMVLHPVRAGDALGADALSFAEITIPDGFDDPRDLIGLEARVNLYPGRPVRQREVGMPTVIQRNAVVPLIFRRGGLVITLEGRALQRAGDGEPVRVMNLSSRSTVTGIATASGAVIVQ